jgi:outer membrane protein assembly factor BamD (BamD/ComL family)
VKIRQIITVCAVCVTMASLPLRLSTLKAETFRLNESGNWSDTGNSEEEQFILRVAEMKKLVDAGKPNKVSIAIEQLKADFPDIAGADFDAFTEAEMLLAKGNLTKAVRQYEKFLDNYPASPLRDAALQREFGIASDFLAGRRKRMLLVLNLRRYDEGVKIMEKISDRAGSSDVAKRASIAVALSYENRRKYEEAYLKWSEIQTRWPAGQIAKDALLEMAKTKYATYRGPAYDATGLISAKSYYENFKLRYPQEAQQLHVDDTLSRISEQLAEKLLGIAEYYDRTQSKGPANMYYQMVIDDWPQSKAARTAREKLNQK